MLTVILVTIVTLTTFLHPAGVNILVGFFVFLVLLIFLRVTIFRIPQVLALTSLDLPIFLSGVSLPRGFHKGCVNDFSLIERESLVVKEAAKLIKQTVKCPIFRKLVPACPYGLFVRHF